MSPNCSQCKRRLDEDGPAMTSYGNEEVYCFCSKECGDKRKPMNDLHLIIKSSPRIKEVYLDGERRAAIYENGSGCIDKVFLYPEKEKRTIRTYVKSLDVVMDLLAEKWT